MASSINGMAERFRELLAAPGGIQLPGCYDVLSAMLLEGAGFPDRCEKAEDSVDFVCADLYDKAPYVDFHYDITDLGFADGSFDLVVCNAVLEHIEDPQKGVAELHRVLKPGGQIWVEVPMNQPYHPAPYDFWRVTLPGLEVWLRAFRRIKSGCFGNFLYNGVYFHGAKL